MGSPEESIDTFTRASDSGVSHFSTIVNAPEQIIVLEKRLSVSLFSRFHLTGNTNRGYNVAGIQSTNQHQVILNLLSEISSM